MAKYRVKREPVVQPQDQFIRHIPLSQGKVSIVSTRHFEYLSQWNWYARWDSCVNNFYAVRKEFANSKQILMHRVILGLNDAEIGDHRDGNTLNNRDENLRKCSALQNSWNQKIRETNTSGYPGVDWSRESRRWTVRINVNGKRIFLGRYAQKEKAIEVRKAAEIEHHGEFVRVRH